MRSSIFLVPILTIVIGSGVSFLLYQTLRRSEVEFESRESAKRAQEIVDQVDLRISNSLLRIQSYEEYIGGRVIDYRNETAFLKQALKHTLFQRMSIFQVEKSENSDAPVFRRVYRIDIDGEPGAQKLPPIDLPYLQSELVRSVMLKMNHTNESRRVVFYQYAGVPIMVTIVRSTPHQFLTYSAPTTSVLRNSNLRPNEVISIRDPVSNMTWLVQDGDGGAKTIKSLGHGMPDELFDSTSPSFVSFPSLPQTGINLEIQFTRKAGNNSAYNTLSFATITGIFGGLMSAGIALLFWSLLYQNKRVSGLVIEKTRDLEHASDEVHEALLVKTRFIGSISHEIRTPLNLMLGMIDLCEERKLDVETREYLKSMRTSGNHLIAMIDDLLGLARSESSDFKIQSTSMNLVQFLDEIGKIASQGATKKNLRMHICLSPELPAIVKSDPSRLRQIILNLLKNAFKYTNEGYVCLRVSTVGAVRGVHQSFRFDVIDSGVGIPADKASRIFDAFFQLDSTHLLSEGGVGLGLSIVKELVRKLDGKIEVTSDLGTGSRFRVELDLEIEDSQAWLQKYEAKEDGERSTVCLVSADSFVSEAISAIASHSSIRYAEASISDLTKSKIDSDGWLIIDTSVGEAGIRSALEKHDHKRTLILGSRAGLQARFPNLRVPNEVPVITNSPIAINDVLIAMGFFSRRRRRVERLSSSESLPDQDYKKVLDRRLNVVVADDDEGNRQLYKAYLKDSAWNIQYAEDGAIAWDIYLKTDCDFLILDVRMPGYDGLELTEKIRTHERAIGKAMTPVLLVTADALDQTLERARRIPGASYLTKPVRKTKLLEAVSSTLDGVTTAPPPSVGTA